jgi:hypothetical protein
MLAPQNMGGRVSITGQTDVPASCPQATPDEQLLVMNHALLKAGLGPSRSNLDARHVAVVCMVLSMPNGRRSKTSSDSAPRVPPPGRRGARVGPYLATLRPLARCLSHLSTCPRWVSAGLAARLACFTQQRLRRAAVGSQSTARLRGLREARRWPRVKATLHSPLYKPCSCSGIGECAFKHDGVPTATAQWRMSKPVLAMQPILLASARRMHGLLSALYTTQRRRRGM